MILGSGWVIESLTLVLTAANCVFAAGDEKNGHAYFTKAELPDMTKILPPFPAFESARFVADQSQHLWGKLMRLDEERASQAQRDAVYSMQTIIDEFGPLFGLEISKEETPEIYSILQDVCASCDSIYSDAKAKTDQTVGVHQAPIIEHPATRAYRLDGTPASDTSRGVIIKGGQKVMAQ